MMKNKFVLTAVICLVVVGMVAKMKHYGPFRTHAKRKVIQVQPLDEVVTHGSKGPKLVTSAKKVEMPVTHSPVAMKVEGQNLNGVMKVTKDDDAVASMEYKPPTE